MTLLREVQQLVDTADLETPIGIGVNLKSGDDDDCYESDLQITRKGDSINVMVSHIHHKDGKITGQHDFELIAINEVAAKAIRDFFIAEFPIEEGVSP